MISSKKIFAVTKEVYICQVFSFYCKMQHMQNLELAQLKELLVKQWSAWLNWTQEYVNLKTSYFGTCQWAIINFKQESNRKKWNRTNYLISQHIYNFLFKWWSWWKVENPRPLIFTSLNLCVLDCFYGHSQSLNLGMLHPFIS